jgi:hypothetical protein
MEIPALTLEMLVVKDFKGTALSSSRREKAL